VYTSTVARLLLLVALCGCGRLGFGDRDSGAVTGDAEVDAFELLREDGGVDKLCSAPLAVQGFVVARAHACAGNGGAMYCWGANASGQLGVGDTSPRTTPALVAGTFNQLWTMRGDHTCAMNNGELYCWGANGDGQLGLGDTTPRSAPTLVGSSWSAVAAGSSHTCGIQANEMYCWGRNDHGQLGLGDTSPRTSPSMLATLGWRGVNAGTDTTCAPVQGGIPIALSCWGRNDRGQLGSPIGDRHTPQSSGCCDYSPSLGGLHTAADHAAATLFVWGANDSGQLGLGDTMDHVATQVPGAWGSAAAGDAHSCAIDATTRALYCWGANDRGQLGIGGAGEPQLTPTRVGTDSDWSTVRAGGRFTCATKQDQRLFCWGANDAGQLGIGHSVQRSHPVQVCLGE
jgi:hypothetical protein